MSDDDEEYEYDYGSDADYDNDEENENNETEDELIEIENSFYEGEDLFKNNPQEACELFNKVIQLETQLNVDKWYVYVYDMNLLK